MGEALRPAAPRWGEGGLSSATMEVRFQHLDLDLIGAKTELRDRCSLWEEPSICRKEAHQRLTEPACGAESTPYVPGQPALPVSLTKFSI